jgi:hypothetical protein
MKEIKKILWVMNPGVALRVSKSKAFVTFKFEKNTWRIQVPKETPEPFPACSALAALSSRASKTSSGVA